MLKKALGLVITAVMLLGVVGLTACNNNTLDALNDIKNDIHCASFSGKV